MNAISRSSSPSRNRLEGFALTALLQGLPTYAGAVLILRLAGAHEIVGDRGGAAIFVVLASLFHGLLVPWLGPRFPRFIRDGYEPLIFDPSLSFSDKIAQWRAKPTVSLQLMTIVIMPSLLAVSVASIR